MIKAFFAAVWERIRVWALRLTVRVLRWAEDRLVLWAKALDDAADAVEDAI